MVCSIKTAVTDDLILHTICVAIRVLRREKERVRIVQRIESSGNVRHRHIERSRFFYLLLSFGYLCLEVHAMELRIVVVLLYVVRYRGKHVERAAALKAGYRLLRPNKRSKYEYRQ